MTFIRLIMRRLLLWSNVFLAIALLLSFYLTFANPATFWPAGFAGLPFIFCWFASALYIPVWLGYRRKYWLISLLAMLLTIPGLAASWGFHPFGSGSASRQSFTVMTFNCSNMGLSREPEDSLRRPHIYEELAKASPDVLCLQEFFTNSEPTPLNHLDSLRIKLKYPYYYVLPHTTQWDHFHFGTAIFSRFPLLDTGHIPLNGGPLAEDMITARLLVHGDTVRILSAHLASYRLQQHDYLVVSSPKGRTRGVMRKMRRSFGLRSEQVGIVRREIEATQGPLVVVGDFNDVPVSYTYKTIRGGTLQDAFLAKGSGLGRTFSALTPNLRIDYILPDKHFNVENFTIYRRKTFEHYPIMTRLSIRK